MENLNNFTTECTGNVPEGIISKVRNILENDPICSMDLSDHEDPLEAVWAALMPQLTEVEQNVASDSITIEILD